MAPVDPAFTCRVKVMLKRHHVGAELDARGRRTITFDAPEPILVWAFHATDTVDDTNGHAARRDLTGACYPPTDLGVQVNDRIELPGKGWFTVTAVGDFDNNSTWSPGLADVKLRKVDG